MENNSEKLQVYNLIILDRSGSMSCIEHAAISGFNETVDGIRSAAHQFEATQEHYVSLLTFCSCTMEYAYDRTPIAQVHELTSHDYRPCCGTPLYDAMGRGINDMLRHTEKVEGATVVVTIITDGEENSSHKYSGQAIKALVDKMRTHYGWNFSYIGTNQDVERVAKDLSIENTMTFEYTEDGMSRAFTTERRSRNRLYTRMDEAYSAAAAAPRHERLAAIHDLLRKNRNYQQQSEFAHRITPVQISHLRPSEVFVFGSNGLGVHGGGAARAAVKYFGAIMGQAEGMQGQSYAINSMDGLNILREQAERFIRYAKQHAELTFLVTPIGCGIAGYTPRQVAPLFSKAIDVENIHLPESFWKELI